VPDWVHLLPAGEIRTVDGRGPYRATSLQSVIDHSLKPGDKLPIDENHATDKGAALGLAAPARAGSWSFRRARTDCGAVSNGPAKAPS
jgi:phage I-like protein